MQANLTGNRLELYIKQIYSQREPMASITFKSGNKGINSLAFLNDFLNTYEPDPQYPKKILIAEGVSIFGSFVYSTDKETGEIDLNLGKSKITGFDSDTFSATGFTLNWAILKKFYSYEDGYFDEGGIAKELLKGNDIFKGSNDDDEFFANSGNDKIYGFAGSDDLYGEAGNDYIDGGDDDDFISGGVGNNTLVGGKGSDVFEITMAKGTTTINDFTTGSDKIQFLGFDGSDFLKVKKFSGVAGEFIATTAKSVTTISFDGNGDKKADVVFKLKGSISVTADDFQLGTGPADANEAQSPDSISFLGLKSAGSTGASVPLPSGQSSSSQILGALTGTKQGQLLPT